MASRSTYSVKMKSGEVCNEKINCDLEPVASKDDGRMYGIERLNIGTAVHGSNNDSE